MNDDRPIVLVVDDTPDNIAILTDALAERYRVRAATTGERALRICRSDKPPAAVLLDVLMPEMDGFEVCRQLKADPATADIPVIFVSGLSAPADEERGIALGGADFMTRPVSAPMVRHRVQIHLELSEVRRRLCELNEK